MTLFRAPKENDIVSVYVNLKNTLPLSVRKFVERGIYTAYPIGVMCRTVFWSQWENPVTIADPLMLEFGREVEETLEKLLIEAAKKAKLL